MDQLINNRDLKFQLYELSDIESLFTQNKFAEHNKETVSAVLEIAEKIALKYFLPHNHKADQNEPRLKQGVVEMIPEIKEAFDAYRKAGFIASSQAFELGGMQLPFTISLAASSYFFSANPSTTAYGFLTSTAANLIQTFASDQQKEHYLAKMLSGDFSGTMALTESGAGSSLSDITTQAIPYEGDKNGPKDGRYKIKGQKIFISGGDHQLTDNIIHLVLAKIKSAPTGVKGISLFIVPKFRLDEKGNPAEANDVNLAGLFHKMGYRGTTSTALSFGENNDCIGYLVGEEHHGLKYMFQMMNEARLWVGFGAAMIGYRGYLASLAYAKERPQGRKPSEKNPSTPQVNIIEHADVKRMLLAQKAYVEGGVSLCFYSANLVDIAATATGAQKDNAALLLDLLMPIVKACNSDYGLKANDLAIQILAGSGYTNEYPVEQCYRDNRLNPIHEGTNGIQALDLLGRKVWLNNSQALKLLTDNILQSIEGSQGLTRSEIFAKNLNQALNQCNQVTQHLATSMATYGADKTLANAGCYLDIMGKLVFSWMWLKQSIVAEKALAKEVTASENAFYQGKIQAAQYFIHWELPKLYPQAELLNNLDDTCMNMQKDWF